MAGRASAQPTRPLPPRQQREWRQWRQWRAPPDCSFCLASTENETAIILIKSFGFTGKIGPHRQKFGYHHDSCTLWKEPTKITAPQYEGNVEISSHEKDEADVTLSFIFAVMRVWLVAAACALGLAETPGESQTIRDRGQLGAELCNKARHSFATVSLHTFKWQGFHEASACLEWTKLRWRSIKRQEVDEMRTLKNISWQHQ